MPISDNLSNCAAVHSSCGGRQEVPLLLKVPSFVVKQNSDDDNHCAEATEECYFVAVHKDRQPDGYRSFYSVTYAGEKHTNRFRSLTNVLRQTTKVYFIYFYLHRSLKKYRLLFLKEKNPYGFSFQNNSIGWGAVK